MWWQIVWGSIFGSVVCLWFLLSPYVQKVVGDQATFATVFFTFFMFLNICNAFNARADGVNIFTGLLKNKAFIVIMALIIVAQFAIIYWGGAVFRTVPISWLYVVWAGVLALSMVPAELFRKAVFK